MKDVISRADALALLKKYNTEAFHMQHAYTVEGVMRWFAEQLGYGEDADFWATVGLLHDIDYELYPEALLRRVQPAHVCSGYDHCGRYLSAER